MPIDQRHDTTHSVEGWICKLLFCLQSLEPLLHLQRFYTKRNSVTPSWEQSIAEHSLVAFYSGVRFWMDGFCAFNQLVLHVVQSQIAKRHSASRIYRVDL